MRQQGIKQTDERRTMQFVYGNTVKEMQASSPSRGEEVHRELEEKKRREQEERERRRREEEENQKRKRKRQATARMNPARMLMSPGYLLFVAGALAVMAVVTVCYLQMRAELTRNTKQVAALESQLVELKSNNDSREQKLEASVDLESIRRKAMEELGMVYPSQGQIEYFEVKDSDYMNQYGEIPKR